MAGQRRLKQGSVLLIGTGGLGSPLALYLAAAGVGRITVADEGAGIEDVAARFGVSPRRALHRLGMRIAMLQLELGDHPRGAPGTLEQAHDAIDDMLSGNKFGSAGARVVVRRSSTPVRLAPSACSVAGSALGTTNTSLYTARSASRIAGVRATPM